MKVRSWLSCLCIKFGHRLTFLCADMILELGELDPQVVFFEPIQKSLDQYKAAKMISRCVSSRRYFSNIVDTLPSCHRKLTRRLEDLTHESSALKAGLAPQLKSLSNLVSELVNFGIQVRCHFLCTV